jgi:PatG C-terminal
MSHEFPEDNNNTDSMLSNSNISVNNNLKSDIFPFEQHQQQMEKPCDCGGGRTEEPCSCKSKNQSIDKSNSYVFAIGRLHTRFPTKSIEKEYRQAIGRVDTTGQTDYEAMRTALSQRQNRYLLRQICWVFTIEGLETYIVRPRDPSDFDLLVDALRTPPRGTDIDVIIGTRGPIATPEMCGGLVLPIVIFEQIYSFDVDTLMKALPDPEKKSNKAGGGENSGNQSDYRAKSEELFYNIMQMADNAGGTDEHRALNYIAVRYPAYYEKTAEMNDRDFSLTGVEIRPSRLSGTRKIVDCIFSYTNRKSDFEEKWFCRVDVTEIFPFLVTKMSQFYDR